MNAEQQAEYDARYKKPAGSLRPVEEVLGPSGPLDLAALNAEDREQERAELEAAGYDYGGEEPWIELMRSMGRRV